MITARPHNALLFDTLGGVYQALTEHPLWSEQNSELANHWGELGRDAVVLDLGTGTGIGTLALEARLPKDAKIIGIDLEPTMIARANRRLASSGLERGRVEFRVGDATALADIKSGSVNAVVANSFLYLVPNPAAMLAEAHRVLAPGGHVVFMEPRAECHPLEAVREGVNHAIAFTTAPLATTRLVASMIAWRTMSGIIGRRTQSELKALFAGAGFTSVAFKPTLGGLGQHIIATR